MVVEVHSLARPALAVHGGAGVFKALSERGAEPKAALEAVVGTGVLGARS